MNEQAKTFADLFRRFAQYVPDTLHIYTDGLVMAVSGMSDRHLDIRDILKRDNPAFEETRAGNISVFLIPMDMTATAPEDLPPHVIGPTTGYHDHRQEDLDSLDTALDFFRPVLNPSGSDGQHRH